MNVSRPKKVLIISHDKIGTSMAGPGIRYHYIAETLSDKFDVTVGFFDSRYLPEEGFSRSYETRLIDVVDFIKAMQGVDIVISHWLNEDMIAYCNQQAIFLVFDLYVIGPVENLTAYLFNEKQSIPQSDEEYDRSLHMYRRFFENGDLFLVSNRRQLDFWIGYIFGADQIHQSTYHVRPIYDRIIYAPMGIDASIDTVLTKKVIKGVIPGIAASDKVLLWTGGIWGHFDAQVLIKAMGLLREQRPDVKLFFFGTKHPNPDVVESVESVEARKLARRLKLIDNTVFFNDGWVSYHDRINYLLEGDVAVNAHKQSIETEFSHRTRVLDHLMAGLPTVSTEGDYLSDSVIKPDNLGLVVPPGDEVALQKAIVKILEPSVYKTLRSNVERARHEYDWAETLKPLAIFLLDNPQKMARTAPELKLSNRAVRLAKRVLPVPVKKVILRALKPIR